MQWWDIFSSIIPSIQQNQPNSLLLMLMLMLMEVQIISQKLIKPSLPTPPHLQNLTLSFLDLRLSPRTVPLIFYYPNHHHPLNSNLLTKSLSNILTLFYPLAGRYIKQTSSVKCNDEGIQYSEALVNTELTQILKGQFQVHELNSFVPDDTRVLQESDTSPLLAIQVNIFKCGGLAIGVVNSQRIVDGFTLYLFMNGWAKACKTGDLSDFKVPTFKSGEIFPPRDDQKDQNFILPSISVSKSELVTERLVLKAKEKITTSVAIAVIWRAQIKAARARHGVPRSSLLSIAVDLRGKIKRKLPENCCGNFVTYGIGRFEVEDHEKEMSLSVFVDKVRDVIKKTISEVNGDGDLYELVMRSTRELAEEAGKGEGDIHRFSSGRDFPTYEVDFGWGKPAWVSHAKRVFKSVLIVDSGDGDGDGVEAWVTMDKEELGYFRDCLDVSCSLSVNNGRTKLGSVKIKSCM